MASQRARVIRSHWRGAAAVGRVLLGTALVVSCASAAPPPPGWGAREFVLEQRCQQGTAAACGELGGLLVDKSASDRDVERGLVLLEIGCGQGDVQACTTLGVTYGTKFKGDSARPRTAQLLSKGCGQRSAVACTALGEVALFDPDADRRQARESLRVGCELGDARGCELYAQEQAKPAFGNSAEVAEDYFAKACSRGRLSSCHYLAMGRLESRERGAVTAMIDNCQQGFAPSCGVVARLFAPLLSAAPDCRQAVPPARIACAAKDADACAVENACALPGPGRAAGVERLRVACEGRPGLACLYWGDANADGGVVSGQIERAYVAACEARTTGFHIACARLAAAWLAAANTRDEAERHLALLRQACERSDGQACCALARAHESGKWVAAESATAAELRAKACSLGHEPCCARPAAPQPEQR
jgi:TPR repeat protein